MERGGGTGTGNGFYAQSEIYGGRYARAKIILISERKGGKVSQAGWLARWPCFGQGISSIIIIINARTRGAIASSASPSPDSPCAFSFRRPHRAHTPVTHIRIHTNATFRYYTNISLSLSLSLILDTCTSRVRVYVYMHAARACPLLSQLYTRGLD